MRSLKIALIQRLIGHEFVWSTHTSSAHIKTHTHTHRHTSTPHICHLWFQEYLFAAFCGRLAPFEPFELMLCLVYVNYGYRAMFIHFALIPQAILNAVIGKCRLLVAMDSSRTCDDVMLPNLMVWLFINYHHTTPFSVHRTRNDLKCIRE